MRTYKSNQNKIKYGGQDVRWGRRGGSEKQMHRGKRNSEDDLYEQIVKVHLFLSKASETAGHLFTAFLKFPQQWGSQDCPTISLYNTVITSFSYRNHKRGEWLTFGYTSLIEDILDKLRYNQCLIDKKRMIK